MVEQLKFQSSVAKKKKKIKKRSGGGEQEEVVFKPIIHQVTFNMFPVVHLKDRQL